MCGGGGGAPRVGEEAIAPVAHAPSYPSGSATEVKAYSLLSLP